MSARLDCRLPSGAHTAQPWRIHEIAPDFPVEDVWALPARGRRGEFRRLVELGAHNEFPAGAPWPVRPLWDLRWKIGGVLGWDGQDAGLGERVASLRDRLPADLRDGSPGPDVGDTPLRSVYVTEDEWVAEIANRTVHSLMHVGWVPDEEGGGYRGQMAVLTKPNGPFGVAYMAAIKPFRWLLVYPALMRTIERGWTAGAA